MTKREQAEDIIYKLDRLGRDENPREYGLPVDTIFDNPSIFETMVNAVLDIIDPRQSEVEESPRVDFSRSRSQIGSPSQIEELKNGRNY